MKRSSWKNQMAVLAFVLCSPAICFASRPEAVATRVQPDLNTGIVVLRVTNVSGKDISAFNLSLVASYSNGTRQTGERMVDLLPRIISKAEGAGNSDLPFEGSLRPGDATEETTSFAPILADGSKLSSVVAEADVVVFTDNTADVQNEAAFGRIVTFRKSSAAATEEAVKVMNRHRATARSEREAAAASAREIKQILVPRAKADSSSSAGMQLAMIIEDLERIAMVQEGRARGDLRDYVSKREMRATRMSAGARIEKNR